jgi:hypothetical protein
MTTAKQDELIERRKAWWTNKRKPKRVRFNIKNINADCRRKVIEAFMRGGNPRKIGDKYGLQKALVDDIIHYEAERYKQMKEDENKLD